MKIREMLARLSPRRESRVRPSTLREIYGTGPFFNRSTAGVNISEAKAWNLAAVYSCVRVLAESYASTPIHVYRRSGGGRTRLRSHPVEFLCNVQANPEMTGVEWRETLMGHLALRGNHYSYIERDSRNGTPVGLWPMRPDHVTVERDRNLGLVYHWRPPGIGSLTYPAEDVLHVKGLSPDGLVGYSPLVLLREVLGQGVAANELASRFYANDSTPPGVLQKKEGYLDDDAYDRLRRDWEEKAGGANRHRMVILEDGLSWQQVGIPPEEAQFLETRKLNRSEIGGCWRVPAHMIGDLEKATYSNIVEQDLGFLKHTMTPYYMKMEAVVAVRLLFPDEREAGVYAEHQAANLLRGDIKTRYESYALLWDRGIMTSDEIRERENLNPLPDGLGAVVWIPVNYQPADLARDGGNTEGESGAGSDSGGNVVPAFPAAAVASGRATPRERISRSRMETRARKGIERSYRSILREAMGRVVRREVQKVKAQAKRELGTRGEASFLQWLQDFYADTDYTTNQVGPVLRSMSEAVGVAAAAELDLDFELTEDLADWIEDYLRGFALAHANQSRGQLEQVLKAAPPESLLDALLTRLEEWETEPTRAEKIAGHRSVDFGQGFARTVWAGLAVQRLVWNAYGDSCPYCLDMDGKVVGIEEPFLPAGQLLNPEGAETPLSHDRDVYSPPVHGGCDCAIEPGG